MLIAACVITPLVAAGQDSGGNASKPGAATQTIYGSQVMTPEERAAYQDRMRAAKTPEAKEQVRREHHAEMQARARERGVTLPDQPPRGGRGMGMGPGSGMGPGHMGPGHMGPGGMGAGCGAGAATAGCGTAAPAAPAPGTGGK
jgi:hypothetical protein